MQAIKMNVNQMFSHFQRRSSRIGAEKRPLQIPDKTASRRPVVIMASQKKRSQDSAFNVGLCLDH